MRFAPYVIFMLCAGVVFYFMGAPGPLVSIYDTHNGEFLKLNCPADADPPSPYQNIASQCNDAFFGVIAGTLIAGLFGIVVTTLMGFSAMYIVPLFILYIVLNFFIFPFSFLLDPNAMPPEVVTPLVVLFNGVTVLALLNFIRGGT